MRGSTLDIARIYTAQGWSVVPIPRADSEYWAKEGALKVHVDNRGKVPIRKGWQSMRLTDEQLPLMFRGQSNIGLILGEPSGWITDVDLDCPEAILLAPMYLPDTLKFGRKSAPESHWLYRCEGSRTEKFHDHVMAAKAKAEGKKMKSMIVEIRSTGGQTVLPGSIHPSGERIDWLDVYVAPSVCEFAALVASVRALWLAVLASRGVDPPQQPKPALLPLRPIASTAGYDEAVERFNASNALPEACPVCARKDAWKIKDHKWFCHHSAHPDGLGGSSRGCHFGDAVDLLCREYGMSRGDALRRAGYLSEPQRREEPPPLTDSNFYG